MPVPRVELRVEREGGEPANRVVVLDGDLFRLGSHEGNDVVLGDPAVSRFHCRLIRGVRGWSIADSGSLNGTRVQGVAVRDADLPMPECRVEIGRSIVRVRELRPENSAQLPSSPSFGKLVGQSVAMRQLFAVLDKVAKSEASVLIEGESGTGKELVAREIVRRGDRPDAPFLVVDCGAIAPNLIEAELFGHVRGAFTGADRGRVGAFEAADGGTILLDEIGELPLEMQPKLLRALEAREIRRIGENTTKKVDVRILAATNRRLEREVNQGRFREDLYFRLSVVTAPSRSSLDRLPKALNAQWECKREQYEQQVLEAAEIPAEAVTVAASLDGVMVPVRGTNAKAMKAKTRSRGQPAKGPAGYREVACGSLSFYDANGVRLRTWRMARMPEAKQRTLKAQLQRELDHVRSRRPDLTVVLVADGAANNWEFLATLQATHQVVDFYHAAEHLKRALDLAMGASSVPTQAKFEKLRRVLRDDTDGVGKVIRALKRLKPAKRGDHRDYRTGVNYFIKHRERMHYAQLQAANLPIGSGVIEGTCKSLASDRLKRAGMRWDTSGGQAILNLRAWTQSDRFDTAWALLAANYNAEVPTITAAA